MSVESRKYLQEQVAFVSVLALHEPSIAATVTTVAQSVSRTTGLSLELQAAARFVGTVLGASLAVGLSLAVAAEFTHRRVDDLRSAPAAGFGWGLLVGVVVPVFLVVVAATGLGMVIALPGFLLLFVLGVPGAAVGTLWVGSLLVDGDTFRRAAAGVVTLGVVSAVPVLGGLFTTLVSACGLGVVARASYASRS